MGREGVKTDTLTAFTLTQLGAEDTGTLSGLNVLLNWKSKSSRGCWDCNEKQGGSEERVLGLPLPYTELSKVK